MMKVRTIISIAVAAIGLTSTALSDKYDDLVTKGYRWVTIDGPFACASKDDVDRIIKNQNDENMVRMLEQGRLYFLIRGLIDDNQFVKKSDLLVTIDPRDYDTAFEQKQAIRESFKAQGAAVQATIPSRNSLRLVVKGLR